jgi:hypothetical protein
MSAIFCPNGSDESPWYDLAQLVSDASTASSDKRSRKDEGEGEGIELALLLAVGYSSTLVSSTVLGTSEVPLPRGDGDGDNTCPFATRVRKKCGLA